MLSKLTHAAGIGALALLLTAGTALAATYRVDSGYSSFEVQNDYRPVTGTFEDFEGTIVYEPVQVEKSSMNFIFKTRSFSVQGDQVKMPGKMFFDLEKYPEVRFESTSVVNAGNKLMVTGTLSMLGVTREVTIPVKILGRGTHPETGEPIAGFAAEMKVKLSDLGVGAWTQAAGILGDTLKIRLKMVGVENNAQAKL